jgi:hypothetical protein
MKQFVLDAVILIEGVSTRLSKELSWADAVARFGYDKTKAASDGDVVRSFFPGGTLHLVQNIEWSHLC